MKCPDKILTGKPEGKRHSEDLDRGGRIILKLMSGKYGLGMWIGFIWLRIGTSGRIS
jgi:hypothetical protein